MAIARQAAKQPAEQALVPLNQFSVGGGLLDDVDVTITDAGFCEWDYNGSVDHNVLALAIEYEDGEGKQTVQYYSAGELNFFVPTDDGRGVIPVGDKQMLNDNTNVAKFFQSLIEAGMPEDTLASGDVRAAFIGMQVHVAQHAQPKRQGLIRGGKNADREPTILLVTEILAYPGEEAAQPAQQAPARRAAPAARPAAPAPRQAAPPRPTPAARPSPAARGAGTARPSASASRPTPRTSPSNSRPSKANGSANADGLLEEAARTILTELLVDKDGQAKKNELHVLALRKAGEKVQAGELDPKQKTAVIQKIFMDEFLHGLAQEGKIEYDGATVTLLAEAEQ